MRYGLFGIFALASCCVPTTFADVLPLEVTGFNRDVVVEVGSVGPIYSTALSFDWGIIDPSDNNALYEEGLVDGVVGLLPAGLPSSGEIVVPAINTTFQLQPYDAANSLQLRSGVNSGTLTLVPAQQGHYEKIAVLAAGGNTFGPATDDITIQFSDGSARSATVKTDDWFTSNTDIAIQGFGRVSLHAGGDDSGAGQPRLYYSLIDLLPSEQTKVITSFEFVKSDSANRFPNILAISGSVVPEPTTLTLTTIALLAMCCRRRRRV
jgi:hypothetical protein